MSNIVEKVDLTMLAQLRDLLGERYAELISCFCTDGKRRIDLLRDALSATNFEVIYAEAHGLKGSSNNVGANQLGRLCEVLEQKGRQSDGENIATIFAAVEKEFAAVCTDLKNSL